MNNVLWNQYLVLTSHILYKNIGIILIIHHNAFFGISFATWCSYFYITYQGISHVPVVYALTDEANLTRDISLLKEVFDWKRFRPFFTFEAFNWGRQFSLFTLQYNLPCTMVRRLSLRISSSNLQKRKVTWWCACLVDIVASIRIRRYKYVFRNTVLAQIQLIFKSFIKINNGTTKDILYRI